MSFTSADAIGARVHRQPGLTPRVIIVGGGFAGLEVAKAPGRATIGATIVDRHNHHLFQPLLYQVATAALSAPDIAEPIRKVLRRYGSIQVRFAEVMEINPMERTVSLDDGSTLAYDLLVLATGSRPSYLGRPDWAAAVPGLKTIEDARRTSAA
jgi:NADH:ubiquinone reductase (H+-translocating)